MRRDLVIDANLLLLFVVGFVNRELISRHKRLKAFSTDDFDLLCEVLSSSQNVVVTPNTLTETSNLLGQIDEPAHSQLFNGFRSLIGSSQEEHVSSQVAAEAKEFIRLGLTDAALLELTDSSRSLLTTDLELYLATLNRGASAVNFNHLRELPRSGRISDRLS